MICGSAVGVLSANIRQTANIDTFVLHTSPFLATFAVADTFQGNATDVGIAFGSGRARAHWAMVGWSTNSITATGARGFARILALIINTVSSGGTVILGDALIG